MTDVQNWQFWHHADWLIESSSWAIHPFSRALREHLPFLIWILGSRQARERSKKTASVLFGGVSSAFRSSQKAEGNSLLVFLLLLSCLAREPWPEGLLLSSSSTSSTHTGTDVLNWFVFIGSPIETATNPSGFTFQGLPPEFGHFFGKLRAHPRQTPPTAC